MWLNIRWYLILSKNYRNCSRYDNFCKHVSNEPTPLPDLALKMSFVFRNMCIERTFLNFATIGKKRAERNVCVTIHSIVDCLGVLNLRFHSKIFFMFTNIAGVSNKKLLNCVFCLYVFISTVNHKIVLLLQQMKSLPFISLTAQCQVASLNVASWKNFPFWLIPIL